MTLFILNVFLAVSWASLIGSFTLANCVIGFTVGYVALWIVSPFYRERTDLRSVIRVIRLLLLFLYELVVSSLQVVWDVITPSHLSRPGVIAMPLDAKRDEEILLVANLISLTPGTLSLDVSEDRSTLYVHGMFIDDPDALRRELKEGMERSVMEAMEK